MFETPSPDPVPGLIASHTVNLLIGGGKSGKTILMLSEIENYVQAGQMLGHQLEAGQSPVQCAIVARGGTLGEMHDTIRDLGMTHCSNPVTVPLTQWEEPKGVGVEANIEAYVEIYRELCLAARRPIRLMFVEDFQSTMHEGKSTDPGTVNKFYRHLKKFLIENNVAVIGTINQAKTRIGERYPLLSDHAYGSIAWGMGASSLVGIEHRYLQIEEGVRPTLRKVTVQPAKSKSVQFYMDFTIDGRLERVDMEESSETSAAFQLLDAALSKSDPGKVFKRGEFKDWGEGLGVGERTVDRWISSRSDDRIGVMEKSAKGGPNRTYWKARVQ